MPASAGWYDDGQHPGQLRWWDGGSWTDQYSPSPSIAPAPPSPEPVMPTDAPRQSGGVVQEEYRFPSSTGWAGVEVVGESFRESEIRAVIGRPIALNEEVEINVDAQLVPEPDNPHDPSAISVRMRGQSVGYLERDVAKSYKPFIDRIVASGHLPTTSARLWAVTREDWETGRPKLNSSIRLALAEPQVLIPLNDPPSAPYSVVPWGSGLQVTGEEKHFEVLSKYVTQAGRGLLLVTMHRESEIKGKTVANFVEIRVDGGRVGQMTAASSAHFFPAIDHLEKKGLTAAAWAHIKGSGLAAEVVLQAAKASELDQVWLSGPPMTVPRLIPVSASYLVPKAYVPQKNSGGPRPGTGAARSQKAGVTPSGVQPAKSGCAMVAGAIAGLVVLATIPDVGLALSGSTAGVLAMGLACLRLRRIRQSTMTAKSQPGI